VTDWLAWWRGLVRGEGGLKFERLGSNRFAAADRPLPGSPETLPLGTYAITAASGKSKKKLARDVIDGLARVGAQPGLAKAARTRGRGLRRMLWGGRIER
jgi:hypothetical protein